MRQFDRKDCLLEMFLIFSVSRHESGVTSSVKLAHKVKLQSIISSNEQVRRIPYENFRNIVLKGLNSIRTYANPGSIYVQKRSFQVKLFVSGPEFAKSQGIHRQYSKIVDCDKESNKSDCK